MIYEIELNSNLLVPYYLMSSYMYYINDVNMFKDWEYDDICKKLYDEWDNVEHRHKHLIDKDSLKAGTGYYLKEADYPEMTKSAAWYYCKQRNIV